MTPNKDRKAAERRRKEAAGLVRVELWAHPGDREAIAEYARKALERRMLLLALRQRTARVAR